MPRREASPILGVRAPVAQLDRAPDFESVGRRFESCRARHPPVAGGLRSAGLRHGAARRRARRPGTSPPEMRPAGGGRLALGRPQARRRSPPRAATGHESAGNATRRWRAACARQASGTAPLAEESAVSFRTPHCEDGPVAQLAEQQTLNLSVLGSTPSGLTNTSADARAESHTSVPPACVRRAVCGRTERDADHSATLAQTAA